MGNIKKRTPNTWIHKLTPQTLVLRLGYLRVHLARTNSSSSNSGPFAQTGKSQDAVSLENIQHNSRWTYLSEILIFGLDSTVSVFSRLLPFSGSKNDKYTSGEFTLYCLRSDDDLIPRQLDWAQLRRDWLVIKRAPFWILSLLECDAHLHKFIIELVFLNVFSKTCCEGLYHWWQRELC